MPRAFAWVVSAYVVAVALAFATATAIGPERALLAAAAADVAGTLAIFAFSMAFGNSSFYDPYWSVAPPLIALWLWVTSAGEAVLVRQCLVSALLVAWAVRLTWNWARGWSGLAHEDWRYVDLRTSSPLPYWLTSLLGIHFFPTVQVFLGCLPLVPALATGARPLGALDALATAVTAGALALEAIADEELRAFRKTAAPGEICQRGTWAWLRHPNYLGELLFWWGLWLFGVAADPSWAWSAIGALAITLMFALASVPMLDRRSLARRPGYAEVIARVPALVPRRPRR